jgi:hypothetical protein
MITFKLNLKPTNKQKKKQRQKIENELLNGAKIQLVYFDSEGKMKVINEKNEL